MRILSLQNNIAENSSLAHRVVNKKADFSFFSDSLTFGTKLPPQVEKDVFEKKDFDYNTIKLGQRINGGKDADVYYIQDHPDWVLRWDRSMRYSPESLQTVNDPDNVYGVVASNLDGSFKILKRVSGDPLYELDWNQHSAPTKEMYFKQMRKINEIPNEAFVKYYHDVLNLRKNGYDIDSTNPNNILYDSKKQKFNIVDIKPNKKVRPEVTIEDFYPFLDSARMYNFYRKSDDETRKILGGCVRIFLNRIAQIGKEQGANLKMEKINPQKPQSIMVHIYYNNEKVLQSL